MKRIFAVMLAALMLVTFLPLASQPAQAAASAGVTFDIFCYANPADPAFVDEVIEWKIKNVSGGSGEYLYALDLWKDGQLFYELDWSKYKFAFYYFPSPGKYKIRAWVWDTVNNKTYDKYSDEFNVKPSVNKITKVEPVGATSLRITWNKVPGAIKYYLGRSTDMKNWEWIKETTGTSFANTYLKAGTRYFYKIWYYRDGVEGSKSPVAAGVPMAKTRITSITSPSARRIRMTWARAAGASGYQVAMASRANGSYRTVRIVTGGTTAIFSGVKSGSTLYFKVRPYRRIYTTTYWGQYSGHRAVKVK
ncbi:MAG: fibronectin type III domain-containing protein [Bacillota bacterium]|nr:fibronectin type III domain-containing protein [Bacillota bacterium]